MLRSKCLLRMRRHGRKFTIGGHAYKQDTGYIKSTLGKTSNEPEILTPALDTRTCTSSIVLINRLIRELWTKILHLSFLDRQQIRSCRLFLEGHCHHKNY